MAGYAQVIGNQYAAYNALPRNEGARKAFLPFMYDLLTAVGHDTLIVL